MRRIFTSLTIFFVLLVASVLITSCTKNKQNKMPNVILIIVDTLSAKHLEVYNPSLKNAPNITKFSKQSVVFDNAFSSAPWTKPSIASVFTSLYPSQHGLRRIDEKLALTQNTLTERLKAFDYQNYGVVSHTLLKKGTGFEQGFDDFKLIPLSANVHEVVSSKLVTEFGIQALKNHSRHNPSKPFFMWLHYFDPHYNYQHHPEFDRSSWYKGELKPGDGIRKIRKLEKNFNKDDIKYLTDLYHEEIAYTDKHIGRVFEYLEQSNLSSDTIVILTADHGEEFYEHGNIGHTRTLHNELINVPLIIGWQGKIIPARVANSVSTIDILPSIFDLIKQKIPDGISGESLFNGYQVNSKSERDLFSEVDFKSSAILAKQSGIINENQKLIKDFLNGDYLHFDFLLDPAENNNLYSSENSKELVNKLEKYCANEQVQTKEEIKHTAEEIKQLESLGYL